MCSCKRRRKRRWLAMYISERAAYLLVVSIVGFPRCRAQIRKRHRGQHFAEECNMQPIPMTDGQTLSRSRIIAWTLANERRDIHWAEVWKRCCGDLLRVLRTDYPSPRPQQFINEQRCTALHSGTASRDAPRSLDRDRKWADHFRWQDGRRATPSKTTNIGSRPVAGP